MDTRVVSVGVVAGVAGAAVLVGLGLALGDRVPGVDRWGLDMLRFGPGGSAEAVTGAVSDGLRILAVMGAAAVIGWLLWRGRRRALAPALGYLAMFLVFTASSEVLKEVFGRTHPHDPADYSYPSTHVVMVTAGALIIAGVAGGLIPQWRPTLLVLAATAMVVTAGTRVLLGEHYLTDVAGTALGYGGLGLLVVRLLPVPSPRG